MGRHIIGPGGGHPADQNRRRSHCNHPGPPRDTTRERTGGRRVRHSSRWQSTDQDSGLPLDDGQWQGGMWNRGRNWSGGMHGSVAVRSTLQDEV